MGAKVSMYYSYSLNGGTEPMPRPLTGRVESRALIDGSQAFDVKIRNDRYALGRAPEWTRERAQRFLEATLLPAAKLHQAWWELLPQREANEDPPEVTVWTACAEYVEWRKTKSQNQATLNAAASPVTKHLLPFFAHTDPGRSRERLLSELDEDSVQLFIERKREERAILADLGDKLSEATDDELGDFDKLAASETADLDRQELELLRRYGQKGGRYKLSDPDGHGRISLSSRGLSEAEINRCLSTLSSIITRANRRHGLHLSDPTLDMRVRDDGPDRNWLWPDHLAALATAARRLDTSAERYDHNGREAAMWVLALCGPRVSELCAFTWYDLSDSGLTVRASKTRAGRRTIQVPTIAREALGEHRERLGNPGAETPIWPTADGSHRDRHNVRARLLAPIIKEAQGVLDGGEPLPLRVTPHTFRRTAATYWYWLGRDERTTMHEIGHKSSRLTLEVYAQPRPRDQRQTEMLTKWLDGVEV
jgi:integrase